VVGEWRRGQHSIAAVSFVDPRQPERKANLPAQIVAFDARQPEQLLGSDGHNSHRYHRLILIGAVPAWPHSRGWGYGPSGGLGLVLLILLVLLLTGRL
jgi:hypothetical protein